MPARKCRGNLSYRHLAPVRLSLMSRRHSTALPSLKRYEMRYEEGVFETSLLTPRVELAQDVPYLPQCNYDGHHSSRCIASRMCRMSCLVVNSSCGNFIFSGLRFQ